MGKGKKAQQFGEGRKVTKATFGTPFKACWPDIEKNVNRRIIEEIKREIPERLTKENPSRKTKGKLYTTNDQVSEDGSQIKSYYKDYLVIGINQVTKALEKGPLLLVMVCKSAKPISMVDHLIPLCAMRNTQGCCLSGVSEILSSIFGITSALAVGIKVKENHPLADLIAFIKDKIPPLCVPWVEVWKKEARTSSLGSSQWENTAEKGTEENANIAMKQTSNDTDSEKNAADSKPNMDLCDSKTKSEDSKAKEDERTIIDVELRTKSKEKEVSSENEANTVVKNKETKEPVADEMNVLSNTKNKCTKGEVGIDFDDFSTEYKLPKKTLKRTLDNVGYSLIDTNFKMKEIVVPHKKQDVKK